MGVLLTLGSAVSRAILLTATHGLMLVAFVPTHEMGLSDLERRVYEPSQPAPRTRGTHVERHAYGSGGDSSVNDTPLLRLAGLPEGRRVLRSRAFDVGSVVDVKAQRATWQEVFFLRFVGVRFSR